MKFFTWALSRAVAQHSILTLFLQFGRYRRRRYVVFDKTCRKCTHILFVRSHQLSRADASVSRDRRTNSFTAKALHPERSSIARSTFISFFRFHFLSHNSPISWFCPSDDVPYGERTFLSFLWGVAKSHGEVTFSVRI